MRINRASLLKQLESVAPGLAKREVIEQSSCFVFRPNATGDGREIITFNDEIAATTATLLDVTGAVSAVPLLALLSKLKEDELEIYVAGTELVIRGAGGKEATLALQAELLLPVESVERPGTWRPLPPNFAEAVGVVAQAAGSDDRQFSLTCIHIHPQWVEACDNYQMARYPLETGVALPMLVRQASLKHITGLDMTETSETKTWLHFRNPSGLVLSYRRYMEEYPDLTAEIAEKPGACPATLPGGLAEACNTASIFSAENAETNVVLVELRPGKLRITGKGITGKYREPMNVAYDGPQMAFMIKPKLLVEIAARHNACTISPDRLRVDSGKFQFVSCLGRATDAA